MPRWGMVIDLDRCIGCGACVVACQAENNIPINTADAYFQRRVIEWIRVERYWEGEYPDIHAYHIPVPCQQCTNAPCEPVCPVYATVHNSEGINTQIYNRCIGTRYCSINCQWHVRFFNFWEPKWPDSLKQQLNPDVTVRSRGIMEKCGFCIHRIEKAEWKARVEGRPLKTDEVTTACAQACPTDAIVFGDLDDPNSKISQLLKSAGKDRGYQLLADLNTEPNVTYLKRIQAGEPGEADVAEPALAQVKG
jgi:Fe-S-cluster-containing dehydrogenase component